MRRVFKYAVAVLVFAACGGTPPSANDSEPPKVIEFNPADGAKDVDYKAKITVVFSEPVVAESVDLAVSQDTTALEGSVAVSEDRKSAVFTPAKDLPEKADLTVRVAAGFKDDAGNAGEAARATFTVRADAPSVSSVSPVDQAQNVPVGTAITATFSEAMDEATVNADNFFLKEGSNPIAATVSYDAATMTATLTPTGGLLEGRTYTATVSGAVKDAAGTSLSAAKVWGFTTVTTVPSVTGVVPANNATGVPGNSAVKVTFSEGMSAATLDENTFKVTEGGNAIAGTRSYDAPTRTATFQPTGAYPGGSTIVVTVTTDAKDLSGIGLASTFNSSFTVSNAPSVTASTPSPNETGVALDATVSLTFSAAMDISTLNANNVWIEDSTAAKVAATYAPTATTLLITPNDPLNESSVYTVVVTTGVRSAVNVPFAAEYRFNFTTVGVAPVVSSVSPADGATDVPIGSKIRLTFNEDMDVATFTTANFRLSDGAADVAGAVATVDARTLEFTPSAALNELATYVVIAGTGLTDAAGNGLAAEFRSSFSTEPLPRMSSITPAPGALNVPLNSAIIIAANKRLDPSTVTITPQSATTLNAFSLWEGNNRIEGAISYDDSSRTIRITAAIGGVPQPWGANKRYMVELDGSKLKDLSGNAVGGHHISTFVTGNAADITGPSFVSSSPQNGDTGVARNVWPHADFDEPLDQSTVNSTNVKLLDGATEIPGRVDYRPALRRIVFVPAERLPASKSLNLFIGTAIKDMAGNLRQGAANNITFTTQANDAPGVARILPPDGAGPLPVNVGIRIDLTEPIDPATLSVEVMEGSNAVAGSVSYDAASRSAVFRPSATLPLQKTISVTVKAGLEDLEGASMSADVTSSFTTNTGAHDLGKPFVASSSPADSATGVSSRPTIALDFNEPLDASTVTVDNLTLQVSGGSKIPFALRYDLAADRAILVPSVALSAGGVYEVLVGAGVKDLAGNTLDDQASSAKITFTVDAAPPTVTVRSPAATSTVGNSASVQLTFSEDMDGRTIDADSFTLSFGGNAQFAAVWYDGSSRVAYLQPAVTLPDGVHTVALDGARVSDVAGNKMSESYTFTVSSAGPSVVGTPTPCNTTVDVDDFGNQQITIQFDRGVKKAGGGALDGSALKLKLGTTEQTISISHTAGASSASFVASGGSSPLVQGSTYQVEVTTQVVDAATDAPMTSGYSCTFDTQKVIFKDLVDDTSTTGYTVGAAQPASPPNNVWQRLNSTDDSAPPLSSAHNSIVWRGGNSQDGQNYVRACATLNAPDYTIFVEKQVDLTGLSTAELRFDEWHDVNNTALDVARVLVVNGASTDQLYSYTGSGTDYAKVGKGSANLDPYLNSTIKLRFELVIRGYTGIGCGGAPAGKRGFFVDNVYVVGK